jgi:hypothetical protein
VFSINRDRLLAHNVVGELFEEVVTLARKRDLLTDEHFSVDGPLIQAWASQKSYRRKDDDQSPSGGGRNRGANFHGEKRSDGGLDPADEGPWFGEGKQRVHDDHDWLEPDPHEDVTGVVGLNDGKNTLSIALAMLEKLPKKSSI